MIRYDWEHTNWTKFSYSLVGLENMFISMHRNEGKYEGIVSTLPKGLQASTIIDLMVEEAIKTSEIEGAFFSRKDVLSSIKKNLGVHSKAIVQNKDAEGIAKVMVDVRKSFAKPLTQKKLFDWHKMLLPNAKDIVVGKWRTQTEPMQIVSGAINKRKVHFEAPPSKRVPTEMKQFIEWYNNSAPTGSKPMHNAVVRAAIAHLYFESIHPFEDGNGRIGRALAEKVLSQGNGRPVLLSLSFAIEKNKKEYYKQLQKARTKNEITDWVQYFVSTVLAAQKYAEQQINFTLKKVAFWDKYKEQLGTRQQKAIKRMLDEGINDFEGGLNAAKYGSLNKISKATATRDLQDLFSLDVLKVFGGGRSTSYALNL
jgi:Fic family protein